MWRAQLKVKQKGTIEQMKVVGSSASAALANASGFSMPVLTVFIGLLSMVPALSSDLYMPGLPTLTEHLGTTQSLASLTLAVFFLFMSVGVLVLGSLSDMCGRKAVLFASNLIALVACLACALACNIEILLLLRSIQGFGCGGMVSIGTALAKDCYNGEKMARVIGLAQSFSMSAPVLAPLVGVAVLHAVGWRGSFICVAVFFGLTLAMCGFMRETLPADKRVAGGLTGSLKDMASFFKRPRFMLILLAASITCMPFYDYLGIASFVYQVHFGLSSLAFGIVFACCSVVSLIGPLIFARFSRKLNAQRTIWMTLVSMLFAMFVMFTAGADLFQAFMLGMVVYMFVSSMMRPSVTSNLLAPLKTGVGAASSLINFLFTIVGCAGMFAGSLGWLTPIFGMAVILGVALTLSVCCMLLARKVSN